MKALELAKALGSVNRWTELKDDECDQAAAELRRLAEVNAELLGALELAKNYLGKRVANTGGEGETKVLPVITQAIAKAKEQQ